MQRFVNIKMAIFTLDRNYDYELCTQKQCSVKVLAENVHCKGVIWHGLLFSCILLTLSPLSAESDVKSFSR